MLLKCLSSCLSAFPVGFVCRNLAESGPSVNIEMSTDLRHMFVRRDVSFCGRALYHPPLLTYPDWYTHLPSHPDNSKTTGLLGKSLWIACLQSPWKFPYNRRFFRESSDESSSSGSDNDDDEERRKANQKLFLIGLVSVPILYNLVFFLVNKVAMAGSPEERQEKELRLDCYSVSNVVTL